MADSPFKRAESDPIGVAPPCSLSTGCTAASSNVNLINSGASGVQPLDLSKNPFLSGNYVAQAPLAQPQQQHQQSQQQQTVYIHSHDAAGCTQNQPLPPGAQVTGGDPYYNQPPALNQVVAPVAPKPVRSQVNSVNVISSNEVPIGNG